MKKLSDARTMLEHINAKYPSPNNSDLRKLFDDSREIATLENSYGEMSTYAYRKIDTFLSKQWNDSTNIGGTVRREMP